MPEQTGYEVKCVVTEQTADGTVRIAQIGGDGWQEKLSDVVYKLGLKVATYYTLVDGMRAEIHVVSHQAGLPFLRTSADDENTNNLLKLPRCPRVLPTGM